MYIANHATIRSIDHLGEILNEHFVASQDEDGKSTCTCVHNTRSKSADRLALHRTKCAAIIVNVIMPCIVDELKKEIGTNYYSIIVDESTDVGTVKVMAYCIRYFH